MKHQRFRGWAAGFALFYCTLAGICQTVPKQTATMPQLARDASPLPKLGDAPRENQLNIGFISTGWKAGGKPPKICQEILAVMVPYIQKYPHPDGWKWFVVCDEAAWVRMQRYQGNQPASGILAITNRPAHSTIIRGSAMLHAYDVDYRAQPEHIIAHELCHIYLQSSDESKVDALATKWVAAHRAEHLAISTP